MKLRLDMAFEDCGKGLPLEFFHSDLKTVSFVSLNTFMLSAIQT